MKINGVKYLFTNISNKYCLFIYLFSPSPSLIMAKNQAVDFQSEALSLKKLTGAVQQVTTGELTKTKSSIVP